MTRFVYHFVVFFLLAITIGCSDENDDYSPEIKSVSDLELEYSRVNRSVNESVSRIQNSLSVDDFKQDFSLFSSSWLTIDILLKEGDRLLQEAADPSGERTKLLGILEKMNASKDQWIAFFYQAKAVNESDPELLVRFNIIKNTVFKPSFTFNEVLKIEEFHAYISRSEFIPGLELIDGRTDFDLLMTFAENIRSIRKTFTFARVTSRALIFKTVQTQFKSELDSLEIVLNNLESVYESRFYYDTFIKPVKSFSLTGKVFDFNQLHFFNSNSREVYKLLEAYNTIKESYHVFQSNYSYFLEKKYNYNTPITTIYDVQNPVELFDSVYNDTYSDFTEILFFAEHNSMVTDWLNNYLVLKARVDLLYDKYLDKQSISEKDDLDSVKWINSTYDNLYNDFSNNERAYSYIFKEQIKQLLNVYEVNTVSYKIDDINSKVSVQ